MLRSEQPEGFVLAGGKSSRMGVDKALLRFGRRTFLENAADILVPVCSRVSVVLNKSQTHFIEKLPGGTRSVFDIFEERGALGGIHSAFFNCEAEQAIILACDLPFVTSDVIKQLVEISTNSKQFAAIVPIQTDGRRQPLCGVYRIKDCLPKLEEILLRNNSASVRDFLKTIQIKTIKAGDLSCKKELFANVNSPPDLKKLQYKN